MRHFPLMAFKAAPVKTSAMHSNAATHRNTSMFLTLKLSFLLRSLSIALLLGVQLGCTATTLPPYEATYTTKLRGVKITGTRKFESTGDNSYKVSWKAKALWMRLNEWSEFELIDGKQIRPISYHYTRKGLGTDKPTHILFDWENNVINASKGDDKYQLPLEPNTLDRLSYQVQMQIDLLINPDSEQLNYIVANHDRLARYAFNFEKQEVIETELGSALSRIFTREKRDKTTRIWLSQEQYFVPVKIEQTEDNKSSVIAIKNWKSKNKTARGLLTFNAPSRRHNGIISGANNLNSNMTTATNLLPTIEGSIEDTIEDNIESSLKDGSGKNQQAPTPSIDNTDFDGDF